MTIKTANTIKLNAFFLPYQVRWLDDKSPIKIWEKSRRIGATYVQSYEDVYDALTMKVRNKPIDVWFTSADLSAAKEYINYCQSWAKMFNVGFKVLGEQVIDEDKNIKALSLEFDNGARINALSSNPTQFRSKGGKVVIDEFAFHKDQQALWKAAKPVITWGYPLRIISTHNGQGCLYYLFIKRCLQGKLKWSHHKTPIQLAVQEGLVDKILDRKATEEEKQEWLENEKENCGDDVTWQQEYCCIAVDEAGAFLTFELISSCTEDCLKPLDELKEPFYVGFDIGRKNDLSEITILEKVNNIFYYRQKYTLKNMPYKEQKHILYQILEHPLFRHCAIDGTGIGNNLAEDAQFDFGRSKVDIVTFTSKVKEELAFDLRTYFEDKNIRIPDDELLKNDLHSVKRVPTDTGVIKFDVERSETDGHADRFWSLALAIFAGKTKKGGKPRVDSRSRRSINSLNRRLNLRALDGFLRGGYSKDE